ncbi:BamA/TamA family outer membrane protein [Sphingomonas sp. XMGL2]|uniref:BamA/TamA family outer membrane protein n=2 Tax=Sphingomonas quercus TaxID=2842451 RepID=A0ABS6BKH6_9SPHN|nr:BamA/TamA family outer membrane protein [Sphingomonas quercus]
MGVKGDISILCAGAALLAIAGGAHAQAQPAPQDDPFDDPLFQQALPPLDPVPPDPAAPPAVPAAPADPALSEPLPPLATFDTVPPEAPPEVKDEAASLVRYSVTVSGLKPIGLEDEFRDLASLYKDRKDTTNATQVQARADEDVKLAERMMRAEGYYDGTASATITPTANKPGEVSVAIVAAPGTRYSLGTIAVTGPDTAPPGLVLKALALKSGDPLQALAVENAEAQVALHLPEQGYPFIRLGPRDIALDEATHSGDYTLPVEPGPRASYGGFRVEGEPILDARRVARFARFKSGEVYDSREVDDLRQALIATSLFSTVSVEPVRTNAPGPDGTETVDLLVREVRGPWRSLSVLGGYGTGEGLKITGSWSHRNLFPPEGALILEGVAGTQQQSVKSTFRRSDLGKRDRTFQASAEVARQRYDAYDAETLTLGASLSRQSTPLWQKRWTYSLGGELIASRERATGSDLLTRDRGTYIIAALPLQVGYDRSDSLLDPTRGFRLSARISPEAQKQTSAGFDGYVRMQFDASTYRPLMDGLVLAARARLGMINGASRDSIAPSRRLYAGGGGSVRGFGYQELGPKDLDANPIGGRSLTEFAVEARYRFGNFGVVPFLDAGRVGEGSTPSISGMRYGAGIGARYYTNFGPMRIDVATPLARQRGESRVAVYISIGQAF